MFFSYLFLVASSILMVLCSTQISADRNHMRKLREIEQEAPSKGSFSTENQYKNRFVQDFY